MAEFITFFTRMWNIILHVLDLYTFEFGSFSISILEILAGILLTSMIISIYWKGARG